MRTIDIAGSRYGSLTAISRVDPKLTSGGNLLTAWLMRCDCGRDKVVTLNNLRRGKVLTCTHPSCECRLNAMNKRIDGFAKDAPVRKVWHMYRFRARRKKIDFQITPDEVGEIICQPCFYCGAEPQNKARADSPHTARYYSGIDRVDNAKGYQLDNVVPCCKVCNTMKHVLTLEEFRNHIEILARRFSEPAVVLNSQNRQPKGQCPKGICRCV